MKLYVGLRFKVFYVCFQNPKKRITFYVFMSCCTRFPEHWAIWFLSRMCAFRSCKLSMASHLWLTMICSFFDIRPLCAFTLIVYHSDKCTCKAMVWCLFVCPSVPCIIFSNVNASDYYVAAAAASMQRRARTDAPVAWYWLCPAVLHDTRHQDHRTNHLYDGCHDAANIRFGPSVLYGRNTRW